MKTAIYIEDGVVQLVITPESDFEKSAVSQFSDAPMETKIFSGSFYDCRGGWTRQSEHYNRSGMYGGFSNEDHSDKSLIIRTQKGEPAPIEAYRNDPNVQGMADCMDMVRQELIEAEIIGADVAPMFIANVIASKIAALKNDERIVQAVLAEREACAKIAETAYEFGSQVTARDVTSKIRARKEMP